MPTRSLWFELFAQLAEVLKCSTAWVNSSRSDGAPLANVMDERVHERRRRSPSD
jgi:hypothetical protein